MSRVDVTTTQIAEIVERFERELRLRIEAKGRGLFYSPHEGLGVVTEEYYELVEAVREGAGVVDEAVDLSVAALWAAVSERLR